MLNINRTSGRPQNYKFDRSGSPTEFGPFVGEVMNNVDPTRSGRLQVYIKEFGGLDKQNKALWRTVTYAPQQAGQTPKTSSSTGTGSYGSNNNQQSYGQAVAAPDIGVLVLCFFAGGDPDQGYYTNCIPGQGINAMTPAIGATKNAAKQNKNQDDYFANAPQLPSTEINNAPENTAINDNPQFFNQPKPTHSYVAGTMFQSGTVNDTVRGPITSSAARESPSAVTGQSTPGRPIYQGGMKDTTILKDVESGKIKPEDTNIIGRKGGHSVVMDDGDISGTNALVRIRTAKGHQITLSDDSNCLYIAHANGQTWLEFGQEGTLDVYTTNSINLRTEGTINLHADKDINMWAGGNISMKSKEKTTFESEAEFTIASKGALTYYSEATISVKANGQLVLDSNSGSWNGAGQLVFQAGLVDINPGSAPSVPVPTALTEYTMPDSSFDNSTGWAVSSTGTRSIVTRAPAHEPWPYHNQGVQVNVNLSNGVNSTPPGAPTVPAGVTITKE